MTKDINIVLFKHFFFACIARSLAFPQVPHKIAQISPQKFSKNFLNITKIIFIMKSSKYLWKGLTKLWKGLTKLWEGVENREKNVNYPLRRLFCRIWNYEITILTAHCLILYISDKL